MAEADADEFENIIATLVHVSGQLVEVHQAPTAAASIRAITDSEPVLETLKKHHLARQDDAREDVMKTSEEFKNFTEREDFSRTAPEEDAEKPAGSKTLEELGFPKKIR